MWSAHADPKVVAAGLGARVALSVVFLVAGSSKLRFPGFKRIVEAAGIPAKHAGGVATALPRLEIACALLLALGIAVRDVSVLTLAVLVAFTAVVALNLGRGASFDCGCFGSLSAPIGWSTVGRNVVLALAALLAAASPPKLALWPVRVEATVVSTSDAIAVVVVASVITAAAFLTSSAVRAWGALAASESGVVR